MKKSLLGVALAALFATASFAQTATPVVQPPAPAVLGQASTETAAPAKAAVKHKTKKTKALAKKTAKKGAKKTVAARGKHGSKLSAKAKKQHKLQA